MGNQSSAPYEGPAAVLEGRGLPFIAKYMKSKQCRKVFVMLGAGVSTAAGIPDFRSPGTGLYSNLERLNLPYPEAVFDIHYFCDNPIPFYTLARELYPGRFRPTLTHTFVKLLANHSLLDTCFTQNIDTLERRAGVPGDRIVEAHGSFAGQHCVKCNAEYDGAKMKAAVEKAEIVRCEECGGLVKPDIVFFGESLPPVFQMKVPRLRDADLLFVIGTSLKVHPFASLAGLVPESCPRVLINMEPAGDIGGRSDDVVLLERCDEVIRGLARELGWEDELDREWAKTEALVPLDSLARAGAEVEQKAMKEEGEKETTTATTIAGVLAAQMPAAATGVSPTAGKAEAEDARVEAEVEAITEAIGKALELSESGKREAETITPVIPPSVSSNEKDEEVTQSGELATQVTSEQQTTSESKSGATEKL